MIQLNDLETWAGYLLNHSLGGVGSEDRVMIKGERVCWPLMTVLEKMVFEAGAVADVYLVPPNNDRGKVWSATAARYASPQQLKLVPDWHRLRYESMTKYIEVLGAEDPSQYMGLETAQSQILASADRPFADIRLSKPWVITLYPTPAFAELEGMTVEEFERFIVGASTVDPAPLLAAEKQIARLVNHGSTVVIITHCPNEGRDLRLEMDISEGHAVMSYGLRNFPDGEVFTSPDASSVNGEIFVDLPITYGGHDIQGIYLKFRGGRIITYRAEQGQEYLAAIIETDDGSHRLGEVAFGMNPALDRVLKHPLLLEKVGGTLHIAIGASYEDGYVKHPKTEEGRRRIKALEADGILNRSAQHVDIVTDFRPGGCGVSVHIDDRRVTPRDGVWVAAG
jgi:aminopeptidase